MKELHKINQISNFSKKWICKFSDPRIDYRELVDCYFADECDELGFVMDCGYSFSEKYGSAVHDQAALVRIINDVTDVQLLGSAIYSRWRYFNHWAYSGDEILESQNREWFIVALNRLRELALQNI